jgi:triosephosphate isomerase
MTTRRPLVAANWKMNGTLASLKALVTEVRASVADCAADVALCAPFPYLGEVGAALAGTAIGLGAQNLSEHQAGAYTGEVSAAMLRDYNCRYVIVGHSERRALFGESDAQVAAKFIRAIQGGLTPILCLGELLAEREAGLTEEVVARQLDCVIDAAGAGQFSHAVVTYEPVWAVGTSRPATPEQAQDVQAFIRLRIARHDDKVADGLRILYGGSVTGENAAAIFSMADVDGGLIGGASLNAAEFIRICRAAK